MTFRYQQPTKALVVDDDSDFIHLLRRILRTLDVELIAVGTHESFLSTLKSVKPKFCFVDLNICVEKDEYAIIEDARQSGYGGPIFVLSGDSTLESVTHALDLGATDYFTKPLGRDIFAKKLSYYLKEDITAAAGAGYSTVDRSRYSVRIQFPSHLQAVDEFGISFRSEHLIPKGTLVRVSGILMCEITGSETVMLTVIESSLDPKLRTYVYYGEFEDISEEGLSRVRMWIDRKLNEKKTFERILIE